MVGPTKRLAAATDFHTQSNSSKLSINQFVENLLSSSAPSSIDLSTDFARVSLSVHLRSGFYPEIPWDRVTLYWVEFSSFLILHRTYYLLRYDLDSCFSITFSTS